MTSLKRATKMLSKALDNPNHTYEQHVEILKRRHQIKKLRTNLQAYERANRGFGYKLDPSLFETTISEVDDSDSESGGSDGVHSESQQSEQPGEPEDLGTA
jgi:hypothetical protein